MNNEKKLIEFLEKNNGYITTAELVELLKMNIIFYKKTIQVQYFLIIQHYIF